MSSFTCTLANRKRTLHHVKKPGLGAGLKLSEVGDFDEAGDFRSPFLSAIPVVNVLARLIFCDAVSLLYFALQLVPMAVDDVKIIVGEFAPLLFDLAFHLFPISFDTVPVGARQSR